MAFEDILNEFWDFANWESMYKPDEYNGEYTPQFLHEKVKEKAQKIFNNLAEDIKKGKLVDKLKEKYKEKVISLWSDLSFLVFHSKIPRWVKKGLTKEQKKELEDNANVVPLCIAGDQSTMLSYINTILKDNYHIRQTFTYKK